MAFATTGIAYVIATCTAAFFGLLLVPLGRLMLQWIRLPSQDRNARRVFTSDCNSVRNATLLSCARTDAIY
eukprot:3260924-Pleurochrysis_carterae.AAC.1